MSSDSDPTNIGFVLVIAGLACVVWGFKTLKRRQQIENTPTSKVRSLAMGPVEVAGTVIARKTFPAWLSQQECVYCKVEAQEERKSKKSTYWVTVFKKDGGERFGLQDDTGQVLVDPTKAEVHVKESYRENSGVGYGFKKSTSAFLQANGVNEKALFGFVGKKMRVYEWVIVPQMQLYILGTAGDNPEQEEATSVEGYKDVMVQFKEGNTFFISDKSEKDLLKKTGGWKVAIVGGIIAFAIGLLIIWWRLNSAK